MLARLTITVWLAWLGTLGLMAGLLVGYVPHPHFLPITVALLSLIVAGLALIGGAGWRLIRGPGRVAALTCLLLGVAPLGFMAGHILYGLKVGQGRQITRNLPILLLIPFGESILDLEARFRYPVRTAGTKVVMISTPVDRAKEQVAAMDCHVRALEARLGRPSIGRVHWARGPLFGMQGTAIFGVCMGSRPGENPIDGEGLAMVDRHEVAHCVITSLCNAGSDPPSVLCEGWAEANSGQDPASLAQRARRHFDNGAGLSLCELTGPDWYGRHHWPAYVQGAVLVDYLLRTYGPDRFLALYANCHRGTFARDCQRILGVDLYDLDAAYQADIDRTIARDGPRPRRRLERIPTGPDVDPAAWKAFLAEYVAATDVLLAPYRQVMMTSKIVYFDTNDSGKTETSEEDLHYACSDGLRCCRSSGREFTEAILAHPQRSFQARRNGQSHPWEVAIDKKAHPTQTYRRLKEAIDRREYVSKLAAIFLTLSDEESSAVETGQVVVTRLERFSEGGQPRVRVCLENRTRGNGVPWYAVTAVLAPNDHFAAQSDLIESQRTESSRGEYLYDRYNGIPVLRSQVRSAIRPGGPQVTKRITVVDRRFGPVPESEFTRERLLEGPQFEKAAGSNDAYREPESFADWFGFPLAAGAVSLLAGAASGLLLRR